MSSCRAYATRPVPQAEVLERRHLVQASGGVLAWDEAGPVKHPDDEGDETRATIGDVGDAVIKPLKSEETGERTTVLSPPVRFAEHTILGRGDGTRFRDPDLRDWQSGGHAEQGDFAWSG